MSETQYAIGRAALPGAAMKKLARVDEEIEDLAAQIRGHAQAEDRARAKIHEARLLVAQAEAADEDRLPYVRGNANPAWRDSLDAHLAEIDKQMKFIERNDRSLEQLNARLSPLRDLRQAFEHWHATTDRHDTVHAYEGEIKVPAKADLASVRKSIAQVKADLRATQHAPRCFGELAVLVDLEVNRLRQAGAPSFGNMIDGAGDEVKWPTTTQTVQSHGFMKTGGSIVSAGQFRSIDAAAVLTWLHPDAMRAALLKELEAQIGEDGIPADERARRMLALRKELLALERVEELLIERDAPETPRRADADLRAFLGLSDDAMAPAENE